MRVTVDAALCTGHGRCYALAPEVFAADDFGHCEVVVDRGEVPLELQDSARVGFESCPEHAIAITD
ncbi:MAG: ferredoxin [Acidimicrobiia bacterium]|nr:ferredoxin [Acidimicrobiia bacterium]